jgi:methylmalonyl-CoA mutase
MAKLRALRMLWARVKEVCSISPATASLHVETSFRMMTEKDAETNILRTTIAAFAAAAGGADSIAVLPHTIAHGLPDPIARRVARNTQLILARESHIDFVSDPATGSGSIEALTDALCEAAWDEFRLIESEGGALESLFAGKIQSRIAEARKTRAEEYLAGKRHLIGTTLFPARSERPVATLDAARRMFTEDGAISCERLVPVRVDQTIERVQ